MIENNVTRKIEEAAGRYIAVWNEPDTDARCHAIGELWIKDGRYTDPLSHGHGISNNLSSLNG